jgi:hypothetical protein
LVEFFKKIYSYIGFPSDEYFTFLFSDDAAAGTACCRYLLALEEPKMITNPMKAAVVIAYINIESAITLPSQSLFKNIYGTQ